MAKYKIEFYSGGPGSTTLEAESYSLADGFITFTDLDDENVATFPTGKLVSVQRVEN